ncbi:L-selectin [Aulostomus maculatus]
MKWMLILLLGGHLSLIALGWTYHYSKNTMNWTKAREWCRDAYTDMVVIQNQRENDYLVSFLPNREKSPYYWIGIIKRHPYENWTWIGNNSTWTGENSWALNEPNNNRSTEFCVEIYVNTRENRGKWNDEKCANRKFAVCYKAQCNETSCDRGRCHETINNFTCLCEPGFEGDRCQIISSKDTDVECPSLSQPNGYFSCAEGNRSVNSTCRFKCHPGFLMTGSPVVTCETTGAWSGPRPTCTSYKHALLVIAGCVIFTVCCCICFCWRKDRKRKKLAQQRKTEDMTHPSI